MSNERAQPFAGVRRSVAASSNTASPQASRANMLGLGLGRGKGSLGLGLGKGKTMKRHKKIPRDTIQGITKGDIRRLARRGGVKRMSATIYDDIRAALRQRLEMILKDAVAVAEHCGHSTVLVKHVIYALNKLGKPIYGFDPRFL
ncbi:histone-fold-containing protein [Westerdykella ornata]|uniref:Histone H4 n=1 Tax=Westerdykella ornata TaxID=318751 RepID=A0A6A6JAV8_WESOR|nr:histone-fold-containing protein [Westerdykella ornata]KAF2273542.1 histone-fold-containing protein [Westerdykella ornata]